MPLCQCRCRNTGPKASLNSLLLNTRHRLPQCSLSATTLVIEKPRLLRRLTIECCKRLFHSIVHIYVFFCPGHAASRSSPPHTELHWESVHVLGDVLVHNVPKQNPASLQNTTQNHDPIHFHKDIPALHHPRGVVKAERAAVKQE